MNWVYRYFSLAPIVAVAACSAPADDPFVDLAAAEIVDLGVLVTEDLPQRVWGKALMEQSGFNRNNSFEVIEWTYANVVNGSNAYYTLFNHGGPHIDAPNHVGVGAGLDAYPVEAFAGPVKVFDGSSYGPGWTIPATIFQSADIAPGDVVLIYTNYVPPQTDEDFPQVTSLTREAAEYLANIPVRAFGTDALSVHAGADDSDVGSSNPTVQAIPIHHSFLSRGIPIYEQLMNVEQLIGQEKMYFVGQPLNIADGDGMMVRPLVFVFKTA